MSFKDVMELKDEILKNNRELESRLKSLIDTYSKEFSYNISSFQKKINTIDEKSNKVINSIPNMNFNISKINQIEKFDLRVENRLSSHDLRITTILTEIEKIKTKYDKIVLDNLYVPGHVGGCCQFSNLSEYLLFNINEVNLLKAEKDQLKKDTNNMRNKHDNTIRQIVNVIDGSVKRCNEYTDNKQKDFQLLLDTKMREFNEKVMEIRMNVCKIQMKTEEDYNNLKNEFNKVIEEKNEFTNFFQNKLMAIQDEFETIQKTYKKNLEDIKSKNNNLGKDVKNIKNNISDLKKLIKNYQKKEKKKNDISMSTSNENKNYNNKDKGGIIREFDNSKKRMSNIYNPINNHLIITNSLNKKNKNDINNNNNNNNNTGIRRSMKKRNTMFYTAPILNLQTNKKKLTTTNIGQETQNKDPSSVLSLINPMLHKIVDDPSKEENENNESNNTLFTMNCSDKNISDEKNEKNGKKHKKKKKKEKKINNNSDFSSKSESKSNSKSNSDLNPDSNSESGSENNGKKDGDGEGTRKEIFCRQKRKSKSKKYFTKLTLKPIIEKNRKDEKNEKDDNNTNSNSKILTINNGNKTYRNYKEILKKEGDLGNEISTNSNKHYIQRFSKSSFRSLTDKYNNNDIKDILNKRFYSNVKHKSNNKNNKSSSKINAVKNNKNNYIEDAKNNNNNSRNNIIKTNQKNESQIKNSDIQNNIKKINNNILIKNIDSNNQISRNINSMNNQINYSPSNQIFPNSRTNNNKIIALHKNYYNNTINIFPTVSKNHKKSNLLTPKNNKVIPYMKYIDKDQNNVGYKIVSFDILENVSLPPKVNQYYTLFGKKLRKKPPVKAETISPLEEIYKKQYNKKIKMENISNLNTANDMPKKITPAFGRTAYAFYSKKDIEEFGGNLTNSIEMKTNNNINVINSNNNNNNNNNNISNSNNVAFNLKNFSKNKK